MRSFIVIHEGEDGHDEFMAIFHSRQQADRECARLDSARGKAEHVFYEVSYELADNILFHTRQVSNLR